ncbi:MAG TPA: transcriptional regulator [Blastocatellia bacterium]|nr:transcriptional regulator [Blastocatellia bacterium]
MKKKCDEVQLGFCPVEASIEMLSGKWKGRILWKLHNTPTMRFGELRRSLGTITEKMLSQQLRELESLGLVKRNVYREVPPKVEYSLTDFGRSIGPILDKFAEWGVANLRKVKALAKAA